MLASSSFLMALLCGRSDMPMTPILRIGSDRSPQAIGLARRDGVTKNR